MIRRSRGERVFGVFNTIFMLMIVFVMAYPFLHVIFSSFSNPRLLMANSGPLYRPLGFSLDAYRAVLNKPDIMTGYRNTLLFVVLGTSMSMILTILAAFVFSRKNFMLKRPLMFFCVFTMFFSGGLVPFFLTMRDYGLYNTIWAVLLPGALSTYNMIIMRTYFQDIPDSLEESAKIDGVSDFTLLVRIILPLSKPVLAVMILFISVAYWNAWFYAMVFLQNRRMFPLQLILREILIASSLEDMTMGVSGADKEALGITIKYATIIVATLPVLFVYPFIQKYFVKGVMIGAIKG